MSGSISNRIITNGLIFYVDSANPNSLLSGSTSWNNLVSDVSSGSLLNGVGYDTSNGGSVLFDGTNDLVSFSGINNLTSFSVSVWFKMTGPGSTGGVTNTWYNSLFGINGSRRVLVSTSTNTGLTEGRILVQMGGSNYFSDNNTSGITTTNSWNNVVYTFSPNTANMYVNGIIQTLQSNSSVTFPNDPFYLGQYSNPIIAYAMKGNISQCLIYNRALTNNEVSQNFNALRERYKI